MSEPAVVTFADSLDHLADVMGGSSLDTGQRLVRGAVISAYQRLTGERSWQYLYTPGRVTFVAPYSTGTVVYDHTGGTYERMLTFSDAMSSTIQGWAKFGRIRIAGYVYEVEDIKSSTVVTLMERLNPGADLAAVAFDLYRNVYQLPADFRRLRPPTTKGIWWSYYVSPSEWQSLEWHVNATSAYPFRWTVMNDPDRAAGWSLCIDPRATAVDFFDFTYVRWPRTLKRSGKETGSSVGTVAVSLNGTAVTGSSTTFSADMVGSYIRFGDTSNVPDGLGGLNPYIEQKKIKSYTSATSITLDSAVEQAYLGAKYCVSDPVDIPISMQEAFNRCCEWQLAITSGMKDVGGKATLYNDALRLAFEQDAIPERARNWPECGGAQLYRYMTPLGTNIGG